MSTFCGVISEEVNPKSEEALDFSQLYVLSDWLGNEANYLCEEFQTKCGFIQEQEKDILANVQNLTGIHQKLNDLHAAMAMLELQIKENGVNILQLQRSVDALDQFPDFNPTSSWSDPRASLLKLVESIDNEIMNLSVLMNYIDDNEPEMHSQMNLYESIVGIIDCHLETLTTIEKKIDRVFDESDAVDDALSSLRYNQNSNF